MARNLQGKARILIEEHEVYGFTANECGLDVFFLRRFAWSVGRISVVNLSKGWKENEKSQMNLEGSVIHTLHGDSQTLATGFLQRQL